MATIGKTSVGGSVNGDGGDYKEVCGPYTLPVAGLATKLTAYEEGLATGPRDVKGIVYLSTAGEPDTLAAESSAVTIALNQLPGWVDFVFPSPVNLAAADYWIGIIGAPPSASTTAYDVVAGAMRYNADTYTGGPSDPFGSGTPYDAELSAYMTYEPAAPAPSLFVTRPNQVLA